MILLGVDTEVINMLHKLVKSLLAFSNEFPSPLFQMV